MPKIAADSALLACDNGHEHVVGKPQVAPLVGTPCPWCRAPLRLIKGSQERSGSFVASQAAHAAQQTARENTNHFPDASASMPRQRTHSES